MGRKRRGGKVVRGCRERRWQTMQAGSCTKRSGGWENRRGPWQPKECEDVRRPRGFQPAAPRQAGEEATGLTGHHGGRGQNGLVGRLGRSLATNVREAHFHQHPPPLVARRLLAQPVRLADPISVSHRAFENTGCTTGQWMCYFI